MISMSIGHRDHVLAVKESTRRDQDVRRTTKRCR